MATCSRCHCQVLWVQMSEAGRLRWVALDYERDTADADIVIDGTLGVKVPPDKIKAVRASGRRLYRRHPWYCGSPARARHTA